MGLDIGLEQSGRFQVVACVEKEPAFCATIRANQGRYDMDNQNIAIDGPVRLDSTDGYHITTRDVFVDMDERVAHSRAPVDGTMPLGHFSADRMSADLERHIVRLDGHARLHIVQRRARAAR